MRYLNSAAVFGMTIWAGSGFAEVLQPTVGQKFGDWVFQCSAVAQNQTDCAFVQRIVTADASRQLAQLQILESRKEPNTYAFTMLLPLGLDVQIGVTARIDQTDPVSVPITTCLPRGCIASLPLDESLAGALRTGGKLEMAFTMADGNRTARITGSLNGINEAFTAAAWFD